MLNSVKVTQLHSVLSFFLFYLSLSLSLFFLRLCWLYFILSVCLFSYTLSFSKVEHCHQQIWHCNFSNFYSNPSLAELSMDDLCYCSSLSLKSTHTNTHFQSPSCFPSPLPFSLFFSRYCKYSFGTFRILSLCNDWWAYKLPTFGELHKYSSFPESKILFWKL